MPAVTNIASKNTISEIENLLAQVWELPPVNVTAIENIANKMLSMAISIKDSNYTGISQLQLAHVYCVVNNDHKKSLELSDKGFNMLNDEFKNKYRSFYHLTRGRNFHYMAESEEAQKEYLACIKNLELKADADYLEKKWLGSAYYNLYILFNREGVEFTDENYLQRAFAIYKEIEDKTGLANCYNSFAVNHYKRKEYDRALDYLLKAYNSLAPGGVSTYHSIFSANIGLLYARLGRFDESKTYFEKAKQADEKLKSPFHIAHTFSLMGQALCLDGKFDEAFAYYKKAETLFSGLSIKSSLAELYHEMAQSYAGLSDFTNAYTYQTKYAQVLKDIFNDDKILSIARTRNESEIELKEKEAELLRQKNEQVQKYARRLKISNSELQQFAHVASHDLREPLRMVTSYATLLQRTMKGKLNADEEEYLHYIMQGTKTMHQLIGDLLALSRITSVSKKENIDLNKIVENVLTNLAAVIEEKNVQIDCNTLPVVFADETHMLQLFLNLISNGIKYNVNKTPLIEISYRTIEGFYEFAISDNGIGVDEEFKEKIFLIFQRLHPRDEFSGTGIGLAICKKIVSEEGGKIWVESNAVNGSDFKFTLPVQN